MPESQGQAKTAQEVARRRAAYALLIRPQEACLLRVARRLCHGDDDRAQDLVQDALVRGYQAYIDGRFQEGSNARAWLLRILTNGFLSDYARRQKWEAGVDLDTLTSEGEAGPEALHASAEDRPDTALLAAALDEPLERALAALSPEMRLCVTLVDIEGAEYKEAAAILGVPIGTVRSRLARARLQLHALLYDYAHTRRRV